MKRIVLVLSLVVLVGTLATEALAVEPHITYRPEGITSAVPVEPTGACDILVRYDDGEDDFIGSGYTLGGPFLPYQHLGMISTAPAGGSYLVQSVSFFSEFWVTAGIVNATVTEVANPANTATASIFVDAGGTWEVAFASGICVPGGTDYSIMLCPDAGVWGVTGEDTDTTGRGRWTNTDMGACAPVGVLFENLMIWSCVTPCVANATESTTWGSIKGLYR